MEHWHFEVRNGSHKSIPHTHKNGHKRHEHTDLKLIDYGKTRKGLLANRFKDF